MKRNAALVAAGALALSFSLTACGGSGDDAKAAEAISQSMMESSDDEFTVDEKQADCVGEGMVDKIGVDKLKSYGMLNDDLTVDDSVTDVTMEEADADNAAAVIIGCVDAQAMMAEQFAADDTMTDEQKECVSDAFDDEALTGMFSLIFQGKEEQATNELMEPLMSCMMG